MTLKSLLKVIGSVQNWSSMVTVALNCLAFGRFNVTRISGDKRINRQTERHCYCVKPPLALRPGGGGLITFKLRSSANITTVDVAGSTLLVASKLKSLCVVTTDSNLRFDCHARNVAKACNFYTRALRQLFSENLCDCRITATCRPHHRQLGAVLCVYLYTSGSKNSVAATPSV